MLLLHDAAGDAAALSFGELHNQLNVNTVERAQARQDGATSFRDVAFICHSAPCSTYSPTRLNACNPGRAPASPCLLKSANYLGL